MKRSLPLLVAVIACFTSIASADLVSVDVVAGPHQNPDGLHETWRIVVRFDNEFDRISAIEGLENKPYNLLEFTSSNELYNQLSFDGTSINDFPSDGLGGEAWDSYVTIGATNFFDDNTQLTRDFIDKLPYVPPSLQVIYGDQIGPVYDAAWFYFGAPPLVSSLEDVIDGNEYIDIIVAQFTLPNHSSFTFTGNVSWLNVDEEVIITPFSVGVVPTPGTLTLLALSFFITPSRKRRSQLSKGSVQ